VLQVGVAFFPSDSVDQFADHTGAALCR
jgi:hypothetical protein